MGAGSVPGAVRASTRARGHWASGTATTSRPATRASPGAQTRASQPAVSAAVSPGAWPVPAGGGGQLAPAGAVVHGHLDPVGVGAQPGLRGRRQPSGQCRGQRRPRRGPVAPRAGPAADQAAATAPDSRH